MDGNSHIIIGYSIAHNGQINTYEVCDCHISHATPTPYTTTLMENHWEVLGRIS